MKAKRLSSERLLANTAPGMAIRAIDCRQVSQVDRMLESRAVSGHDRGRAFLLIKDRVTDGAVLSNDFPVGADVLSVVAPEAALGVVMANIIGICLPVHFHQREEVLLVNVLNFADRGLDRVLFRNILVRVV